MRPGICIDPPHCEMFSPTVMMLYGTHSRPSAKRHFLVEDIFDEDDKRPSAFGRFPPVGLDSLAYDDNGEIHSHIRRYKGKFNKLPEAKCEELKQFLREYYSIEVPW